MYLCITYLELMMKATVFNPIQIHLLKMFELSNTEHALEELKNRSV